MRRRFGVMMVGAAASVAFLHCGGGDDSTGAQATSDAGANDATATDSAPSDAAGDSGAATIDVNGTLIGGSGPNGAIVNRAVVVIDANAIVTTATTDGTGKFHVAGVQTPYDVAIAFDPADAATPGIGRYYAGISAANPIVTGTDYSPVTAPPQQHATVTFTVNACNSCEIWFGSPDYNTRVAGTGAPAPFSLDYTWNGGTTHSAPMHIYVADNSVAYISYVDLPAQALTAGGTLALGTPTLAAVSNGNISTTVTGPASYTIDDQVGTISHSDGSILGNSGAITDTTGLINYPRLPNMVLSLESTFFLSSASAHGAVVYTEPTIPGSVSLNPLAAPALTTPANAATGVAANSSLTWSAFGEPTMYTLILLSSTSYDYIYTEHPSIALALLAKGGMGVKPGTAYSWKVVAGPNFTAIDDLVTQKPAGNGVVTHEGDSLTQTFTTQ